MAVHKPHYMTTYTSAVARQAREEALTKHLIAALKHGSKPIWLQVMPDWNRYLATPFAVYHTQMAAFSTHKNVLSGLSAVIQPGCYELWQSLSPRRANSALLLSPSARMPHLLEDYRVSLSEEPARVWLRPTRVYVRAPQGDTPYLSPFARVFRLELAMPLRRHLLSRITFGEHEYTDLMPMLSVAINTTLLDTISGQEHDHSDVKFDLLPSGVVRVWTADQSSNVASRPVALLCAAQGPDQPAGWEPLLVNDPQVWLINPRERGELFELLRIEALRADREDTRLASTTTTDDTTTTK